MTHIVEIISAWQIQDEIEAWLLQYNQTATYKRGWCKTEFIPYHNTGVVTRTTHAKLDVTVEDSNTAVLLKLTFGGK